MQKTIKISKAADKNHPSYKGSPFWKCVVSIYMGIDLKGGGVKACQDGLGHFFFHVCPFDRGGGLKLFGQYPYRTNTFKKGASLTCIDILAPNP